MLKRKTKKHYVLFFIVIALGAFLFLWFKFELNKLSFKYQSLVSIKKKLVEENNKLKINYATLNSPINIERTAYEKLNLKKPSEKQYRFIK